MNKTPIDKAQVLRESGARYVVDSNQQPVAVRLTLEEYTHYLDLLDDEFDSQDEELAMRLSQAAAPPSDTERIPLREYIRSQKTLDA